MSRLFGDNSIGKFEGPSSKGRTDNHQRHESSNGKKYAQYNQYRIHPKDPSNNKEYSINEDNSYDLKHEPHEHFGYNALTGLQFYHGENMILKRGKKTVDLKKTLDSKKDNGAALHQFCDFRRSSCSTCSWWYHERCLQHGISGGNCSDYTKEAHTCSTCSNFDATPGSTRNGDSWCGICNAYGGNPIRHNPSSHTCKAWS